MARARPDIVAAVGAAVATLLAWPVATLAPAVGIDPSWQGALHLAVVRGLDFGPQMLWTYGPLGFLAVPALWGTWTAALALAYTVLTQLLLAYLVLRRALRVVPLPVAFAVALGVAALLVDDLLLALFVLAVAALERASPPRGATALVLAAGTGAALLLLVRVNAGLVAVALVALSAWTLPPFRWRAEAIAGGSFAATFAVLWLAAGSSLAGLPEWARGTFEIVRGYSTAMAYEEPERAWELLVAGLLAAALALLVWRHAAALQSPRRVALLLATLALVFASFKHGFVRHDAHSTHFFATVAVAAVAFSWPVRLRAPALAVFFAALVTALAVHDEQRFEPVASVERAGSQLATLALPSRRDEEVARARAAAVAALELDAETLRLLDGRTVHVEPYEVAAVWAHELRWRPLPVVQPYQAYTPYLDERNADALRAPDAPERVLRETRTDVVDGRNPLWDSPRAQLALLCNYTELRRGPRWQVLARVGDRCGDAIPLGAVTAAPAEAVPVPPAPSPEAIVVARVEPPPGLGDAVTALLYKPPRPPTATVAAGGAETAYRVVAATLEPLVLRAPAAVAVDSIRFDGLGDVTVRFEAVPLRAVPSAP